ncbi:hypothetical protein DSUL_20281 [Desulfovibrionales bacterium]
MGLFVFWLGPWSALDRLSGQGGADIAGIVAMDVLRSTYRSALALNKAELLLWRLFFWISTAPSVRDVYFVYGNVEA